MKPNPYEFQQPYHGLSWRLVDFLIEINNYNGTYRPKSELEWQDTILLCNRGYVIISDSYNYVILTEDGLDMIFEE